jgi:hypothetical protein
MWDWQIILVYIALAFALGYLVRRYIWPQVAKPGKGGKGKECGNPDCGCH